MNFLLVLMQATIMFEFFGTYFTFKITYIRMLEYNMGSKFGNLEENLVTYTTRSHIESLCGYLPDHLSYYTQSNKQTKYK